MAMPQATIEQVMFERLRYQVRGELPDMSYLIASLSERDAVEYVDAAMRQAACTIRAEVLAHEETMNQDIEMTVDHDFYVTLPATWWDHLKSRLPRWLRSRLGVKTVTWRWPLQVTGRGTITFRSKTIHPCTDIPYDRSNGSPYVRRYVLPEDSFLSLHSAS